MNEPGLATIHLHAAAPEKPRPGTPCNGCGVCCASTPCPLSRTLLRHRKDACPALTWTNDRYRCGLASTPERHLPWLPSRLAPLARRLVLRWIAAGIGCDCDTELV